MKKITFGIIISIFLMQIGCSYEEFNPEDWAVEPLLELSESGLVFTAATNRDTIKVSTNYQTFSVSCPDKWCTIEPNYKDSTIIVEVDPNMKAEQRHTTIYVTIRRGKKSLTSTMSVVQMGGYWDVINQFSVYWSSDITITQKETVAEILSNMKCVKGGTFVMGAEVDYTSNGTDTRHNVTLSDFYISKTEVTQKQWNLIMGRNQSNFKGEQLPVDNIEWEEALYFVTNLSRLTGLNFTLPTEAQWEYAARGGVYSMGYMYPGSNDYEDVMIYKGLENLSDPHFTTSDVGQLLPNELGLYDMAGNVAEMCYDWYGEYDLSDQVDPMGPPTGEYHVIRGGDITSAVLWGCVYARFPFITKSGNYIGIRLCIRP